MCLGAFSKCLHSTTHHQTSPNIACMSAAAGDDGQAGRELRPRQQQQEPPPAQPHAGHLRLAGLRCEQTGH